MFTDININPINNKSEDPDPNQNEMDPQHCFLGIHVRGPLSHGGDAGDATERL